MRVKLCSNGDSALRFQPFESCGFVIEMLLIKVRRIIGTKHLDFASLETIEDKLAARNMKCRRHDSVAIHTMRVRKRDDHRRIVDRVLTQEVVFIGWPEVRPARREFSMDMLPVGERARIEARIKATCCQYNCVGLFLLNLYSFFNPADRYRRKHAVLCIGKAKNEDWFACHLLQGSRSVFGTLGQMPPPSERCRPTACLSLNRPTLVVALGEENGL